MTARSASGEELRPLAPGDRALVVELVACGLTEDVDVLTVHDAENLVGVLRHLRAEEAAGRSGPDDRLCGLESLARDYLECAFSSTQPRPLQYAYWHAAHVLLDCVQAGGEFPARRGGR